MKISHQVSLPMTVDEAWLLLDDPNRLAEAMPGAQLDRADGDKLEGRVNVRLGPMNLTYEGAAIVRRRDPASGFLLIDVSGREQRGAGTASATVEIRLRADGDTTAVAVDTELSLTGRPAQLGAGMIQSVAQKIFTEFAERLATRGSIVDTEAGGEKTSDAIDLTRPLLYLMAVVAGVVVLAVAIWLWRR